MATTRKVKPAGLIAVAIVGAAVTAIVLRPAEPELEIDELSETAWFPSTQTGTAVLVNGATGQVVTRVPAAIDEGQPFDVEQFGSSGLIISRGAGVWSVDGSDWTLSAPVAADADAADALVRGVHAWLQTNDGGAGSLQVLDLAASALVGSRSSLPDEIGDAAVTSDGVAWIVDTAGGVWSVQPGEDAEKHDVAVIPDTAVRIVDDKPVLVTLDGTVHALDPDSGSIDRQFRLGVSPISVAAGSQHWLLAIDDGGQLVVADLDAGGANESFDLGPGADYAPPVEHEGLVYVLERTSSSVLAIDPAGGGRQEIDLRVPVRLGDEAHLLVHDDLVWFDDPTGDSAGVVDSPDGPLIVAKSRDEPVTRSTSTTSTSLRPRTTTTPPPGPSTTTTSEPLDDQRRSSTTTASSLPPQDPSTSVSTIPGSTTTVTSGATTSTSVPGPISSTSTSTSSSSTTTTTDPRDACDTLDAKLEASPNTTRDFPATVTVCDPPTGGESDWVMAHTGSGWYAKAAVVGPTSNTCAAEGERRYGCQVHLGERTLPGSTRELVVVRFPSNAWPLANYDADIKNLRFERRNLPAGARPISNTVISTYNQ